MYEWKTRKKNYNCQVTTEVEELINYADRWNQPMTDFIQNIRAMRWAVFTIYTNRHLDLNPKYLRRWALKHREHSKQQAKINWTVDLNSLIEKE
jgi:hypothetical protein